MAHRWDQRQPYATSAIPYIGENGNWWVNQEDTGVQAQGPAGPAGKPGATGIGVAGPALTYDDLTDEQRIALVAYMAEPIQEAASEAVAARDEVMNTLTPATELLDGVNAAAEVILAQQESAAAAAARAEAAIEQVTAGEQRVNETVAQAAQSAEAAAASADRAENAASSVEDAIEVSTTAELLKDTIGYTYKNLLKNTATSQTIYGVTLIVNDDGSVTGNGTATDNIDFELCQLADYGTTESYILSGCPNGGSVSTYALMARKSDNTNMAVDVGSGVEFVPTEALFVIIRIASGTTMNNVTFYPMLRRAEITDATYEPYYNTVDARLIALEGSVVDNLLSTATDLPLSANQGRILAQRLGGYTLEVLPQADYDSLATKDANTLYFTY